MVTNKARSLASPGFIQQCLEIGKKGEEIFQLMTEATPSTRQENFNHIDFHWGDKKVDVKGLRPCHRRGYILLELLNVQGKPGWCSKDSHATHIAFQMEDGFYIFEKGALRNFVIERIGTQWKDVLRENGLTHRYGYEKVSYRYLGRTNRSDIFCYVKSKDLMSSVDFELLSFDNK